MSQAARFLPETASVTALVIGKFGHSLYIASLVIGHSENGSPLKWSRNQRLSVTFITLPRSRQAGVVKLII
jgi:hypothetical protein